jgi:hypothetical protein
VPQTGDVMMVESPGWKSVLICSRLSERIIYDTDWPGTLKVVDARFAGINS